MDEEEKDDTAGLGRAQRLKEGSSHCGDASGSPGADYGGVFFDFVVIELV